MQKRWISACALASFSAVGFAQANLLNEFEPNPAGGDPSTQIIELKGTPGTSFDLWIVSVENDGFNGTVDSFDNVTGTYDSSGLAAPIIDDLENPSNTLILTDSFTGSTSTDIDPNDDGSVLDLSTFGTILDAVGVSDAAGDDASLYGAALGGTDILFNGEFEPLFVFRDSLTDVWYQGVTADFGAPTERIAIFAADAGPEISPSAFTPDASSATLGSVNPTIPEPASLALIGIGGLTVLGRRRRLDG